ncbi:penicillin acylase family protein [Halobaculum litoreum]|uniref:Penicillin acylase family protein n=1 Tax=Halobaculum litoreum TaxID=3031998 RepID=A0ABD5XMK7_9EURY
MIDFYEYETRADGTEYRYGDRWRSFGVEPHTIEVADAPDEEVTVKKSAHGAVLRAGAGGDEFRSNSASRGPACRRRGRRTPSSR